MPPRAHNRPSPDPAPGALCAARVRPARHRSPWDRWRPLVAVAVGLLVVSLGSSPVWSQEDEIPRAVPVQPRANPIPEEARPPARPAEATASEEEVKAARAPGPEGDLFVYANLVFSQKQYKLAAEQYSKYVRTYQRGVHAAEAWYRLGECYLNLSEIDAAIQSYRTVISSFESSEFAGFAGYRIASLLYAQQKFSEAIPYLRVALSRLKKKDVLHGANYLLARCYQATGREPDSIPIYEKLTEDRVENPFWQRSLLTLARIHVSRDDDETALTFYKQLADEPTATDDARGEALVQTGLILTAQDKPEEAIAEFNKVLDLQAAEEWKPLARYGIIDGYYKAGRYEEVTRTYAATTSFILPEDTRPKMLLMVGNSFRYLKQFSKAIDLYLITEQYYKDRPEGREAGYNKLICYYNLEDPGLPRFVNAYVRDAAEAGTSRELINQARLLKAESYFRKAIYDLAAEAYGEVQVEELPEAIRPLTYYRKGFSEAEGGKPAEAISSYTRFLDQHPQHELAASALAKRALSYKAVGDLGKAIEDFDRLTRDYPESEACELAYQQSALLKGQRREVVGMIETFQSMLERFPETKALPEAEFWIGWGYFEDKKYAEAIPHLRKAMDLDAGEFYERAGIKVILAHFYLQQVDELAAAIDSFREQNTNTRVPAQVLGWLGLKYYELRDYQLAEKYLLIASTPEEPRQTRAEVWNYLGKARLQLGEAEGAITPFEHFLATTSLPADRARALFDLGTAQLGAGKYADAVKSVEEGLNLQKDGRVNAQLWLLHGDIEMAQGHYEEAAAKYVVPSQVFADPQITPEAIHKTAIALEKLGQTEKAAEFRKQLESQYPEYRPPKGDA